MQVMTETKNDDWDLVGHDWAVASLRRAVIEERVSHAYLFTGPAGVGKTALARRLAAALLCVRDDVAERPCGVCRACRRIDSGNHPDLHIVESERVGANLKIEQIRDLAHSLTMTPVEGRRQVAILKRFEEATPSAANALLKTLEEPAAGVVLAVLAREPDLLLPTIVSRCQHMPLRPLPVSTVEAALVERWHAPADHAELLAHLSRGRLGWAVRMLEDEESLARRDERLDHLNQLLSASMIDRFAYAEELARDPIVTLETLELWIGWWRDVVMMASDTDAPLTNVDRERSLRDHARLFDLGTGVGAIKALRNALHKLQRNANKRLTLEVMMLDLPRR